jgi:hypothetical protein
MMKKALTIFFILIANIILLAHAVIPHHHHESSVCIDSELRQPADFACNHKTSQHNQEHNGDEGAGDCALRLALFLPSNQQKHDCKCVNNSDKHVQPDNNQAILANPEQIAFVPKINSTAQIPLKTSFHYDFVSASNHLRAPPIV